MIINSTLVFCLIPELEETFKGSKITQVLLSPDRKELLLIARSRKNEVCLFFSAHAQNYRVEILDQKEWKADKSKCEKTNLFSYALGGYIQEIKQIDFDRIIQMSCLRKSQLGKGIEFDLIFELTGRNSNLILVRKDGLIIDCLRKVDSAQSRFRQVLPGEKYLPPPSSKKNNPFQFGKEEFLRLLKTPDLSVSGLLVSNFVGVDQLVAEKIIFEANIPLAAKTEDLNEETIRNLWKNLSRTFQDIAEHKLNFQIITDEGGEPQAISCVNLPFINNKQKIACTSLNSAIKKFFSQKLEEQQRKAELKKPWEVAHRARKKLERKKERIEEDLKQAEKFEQYKKFGDLLMINKNSIKKGLESIRLVDVFEPQQSPVGIPLNANLSPIQNAQAYFKRYRKAKDALTVMIRRKAETDSEILQVEKIMERLKGPEKDIELEGIREELTTWGFLREKQISKKMKKTKEGFSPRIFLTKDGSEILVGKNNEENDYLTFRLARPGDLWFHAQDVPGSHVVLRRKEKKREPSQVDIKEAAQVAAYFSKAREEKKAPVIYTLAKYVKKPKKGKSGLALVEREKTIMVEPKLTDK